MAITRRSAAAAQQQKHLEQKQYTQVDQQVLRDKPTSIIDQLQKNAQATEIDHTNTGPVTFMFLALIQIPAMLKISQYIEDGGFFATAGSLAIGAHIVGFVISVAINSCFMFDITGEITFTAIMMYSYTSISDTPTNRQQLCTGVAIVWCLRLGLFLFWRIITRGSDWRFDKLIQGYGYNLFAWICQGTWVWLQGFCIWTLNNSAAYAKDTPDRLDAFAFCGLSIWAIGFAIEVIADFQKTMWNASIPSDGQKTWICVGLWKYSRHPWDGQLWISVFGCTKDTEDGCACLLPVAPHPMLRKTVGCGLAQ
eukprot:m.303991 g.303991  ORF g.303991 m.303991 type:complete len:309 (-) comp20171_c0_seq4:160-1086(-)